MGCSSVIEPISLLGFAIQTLQNADIKPMPTQMQGHVQIQRASCSHWWKSALLAVTTLGCLAATPAVNGPSDPLPTPARLITRCFHGMGGANAITSVQSMDIKAIISLGADSTPLAHMNMAFDRGGRSLIQFTFLGPDSSTSTETSFGSNGTVAWEHIHAAEGGGWRLLEDDDLAERVAANNWLGRLLQLGNDATQMRTIGSTDFNGIQCWHITTVNHQGDVMDAFFDKKTKLLSGFRRTFESPPLADDTSSHEENIDIYFSDWRVVNGVRLFHHIELVQSDVRMNIVYDSLTINDVPSSTYDLPAEVQALLPTPPTSTPAASEQPDEQ